MTSGLVFSGTRQVQTLRNEHPPQGSVAQSATRDVGLSKNTTASLTFTAAAPHITGTTNTFANFAVGDTVLVEGTNVNNGIKIVTAIDTSNHSYLTTDFPAKAEGPITATVRTL